MTDDSVVVPELPMRQYYKDRRLFAFSYLIAENSFGVKDKFKAIQTVILSLILMTLEIILRSLQQRT
jgi:hypothetical protein